MRDIPKELIIDSLDAGIGAQIDVFELDLQQFGGELLRFHSGLNKYYGDVIWQGNKYSAYPISCEGFETKNEGAYARPTLTAANVEGLMTGINSDYNDALGAILIRRQVPVKYLDAVNFPNGNATADPSKEAVSQYRIEELTDETFETVTYSLATPIDSDNAIIPGRTILAEICPWVYRGLGCGYTGGAVADERDNPTSDISLDKCSKRRSGCRFRYPKPLAMPFGGFPGSSKV